MNISSTERVKKYRIKENLKKSNKEIFKNELLRVEKTLIHKDATLLRENINLSGHGVIKRYKEFYKKIIENTFKDGDTCYFFTITYEHSKKINMGQNDKKINCFLDFLEKQAVIESVITIPEYHEDKTRVHNHGIIKVLDGMQKLFTKLFFTYWNNKLKGSFDVKPLDINRNFEQYITKYIDYRDNSLYNACDSIQTRGIDLNGVNEIWVKQSRLTSIGNIRAKEDSEKAKNVVDAAAINSQDNRVSNNTSLKNVNLLEIFKFLKSWLNDFYETRDMNFEGLSLNYNFLYFLIALVVIAGLKNALKI